MFFPDERARSILSLEWHVVHFWLIMVRAFLKLSADDALADVTAIQNALQMAIHITGLMRDPS